MLHEDHAVNRLFQIPAGHQQFLVELLAGAQTGLHDLDVPVRLIAGQSDHILRQLQNFHGTAHVQHEQLVLLGHGSRLQHQLGSFGNSHEIADDTLVRHGDGAARRDLAAEQGHHGAVGTKHIAEAHRGEGGFGAAGHGLHHHFAQPLAGTHDGGGVHRLVGGNEDELFHAVGIRRSDGVQRTEHVVADGLLRTGLHQGDVLMGGGVEHHVGFVGIKQQLQPPGVPDGADLHAEGQLPAVLVQQFLLDVVGVVFVNIKNDQPLGMMLDDLTAQLTANGTAATGDKNRLAGQQSRHGGNIQFNSVPAQQILDPHLPQLLADGLPVDQLQRTGQRGNPHAPVRQLPQNLLAVEIIHGRDGENGIVDVHSPHPGQRLRDRSADRHAPDPLVELPRVIVEKALDGVAAVGIVLDLVEQLHACRPRADDGHGDRTLLLITQHMGAVAAVAEAHHQHFQHPQTGDGRQQNKGDGPNAAQTGDGLIDGKAAERRSDQHEVLPALGIPPQAVVGLEHKLGKDRTAV